MMANKLLTNSNLQQTQFHFPNLRIVLETYWMKWIAFKTNRYSSSLVLRYITLLHVYSTKTWHGVCIFFLQHSPALTPIKSYFLFKWISYFRIFRILKYLTVIFLIIYFHSFIHSFYFWYLLTGTSRWRMAEKYKPASVSR